MNSEAINEVVHAHCLLNEIGVPRSDDPSLGERSDFTLAERIKILVNRMDAIHGEPLVNESKATSIPSVRESILLEAIKFVTKDRNATHGEPEDNFAVIADFWTTYLKVKGKLSYGLDSTDVAVLMVLMKVSRTITSPEHRDHWVDIAGYAACGGGIATKDNP